MQYLLFLQVEKSIWKIVDYGRTIWVILYAKVGLGGTPKGDNIIEIKVPLVLLHLRLVHVFI